MYLTAKQITFLLLPFVITGVVYIFSYDITKNIRYFFPIYKEYKNKTLDKKASIYLKIEANGKLYQEIKKRIEKRKRYAQWIVDALLYKKTPYVRIQPKKRERSFIWKLQAVFDKLKIAIINGIIVRENSIINGAKVIKILDGKVLLSTKKGKKWLTLFH